MTFFATLEEGGEFCYVKSHYKTKDEVLSHFIAYEIATPFDAILFSDGFLYDKRIKEPRHERLSNNPDTFHQELEKFKTYYKRLKIMLKKGKIKIFNQTHEAP